MFLSLFDLAWIEGCQDPWSIHAHFLHRHCLLGYRNQRRSTCSDQKLVEKHGLLNHSRPSPGVWRLGRNCIFFCKLSATSNTELHCCLKGAHGFCFLFSTTKVPFYVLLFTHDLFLFCSVIFEVVNDALINSFASCRRLVDYGTNEDMRVENAVCEGCETEPKLNGW